jgi:hypothetical protein
LIGTLSAARSRSMPAGGYWLALKRVHVRISERVNSCDVARMGSWPERYRKYWVNPQL